VRVLVAGCAGFIGWKVSELLLKDGHAVTGVDGIVPGYDVGLKKWRLARLQSEPGFAFLRLDIVDQEALSSVARQEPFDGVINLAARAGVRQSMEDPRAYYETNVIGTLNLLELCRKKQVTKFVLASSSSVYGDRERPSRESQPADQPLSPYAASKKSAEDLCYSYHHLYGMDITVLRCFTVYGPAGRPDMSVFRFTRSIVEDEPLVLYGDGSQERDFTYVDDIARGTLAALTPVGFEVINLGSNRPVSLLRLIELLGGLVGRRARIERWPSHPADVPVTWADISKAKRLLGWEPRTPLEAGLQHVVEWYTENREWARGIVPE
jgi:nucleoside-diphosphate-sugar epimerase